VSWQEDRMRVIAETGAAPEDLYVALERGVGDDAAAWCCPVSIGSSASAAGDALRRHMERRQREGRLL
jgi:hypothetical protein